MTASRRDLAVLLEEVEMERSWPIGKPYTGGVLQVRAADFEAYADATDDHNARYRGANAVAPPMFHVRLFIDLMMQFARDESLDINLLRLVHGEHDVEFHGLLRDGDAVSIDGELVAVSQKSSGRLYSFGFRGTVNGQVMVQGTTTYFVRGETPASSGKKPSPEPIEAGEWSVEQVVAEDQADRYAPASGDLNPIHIDADVARKAGLPGVILHGLCTMAFAQRDIIDRLAPLPQADIEFLL